MSATSAVRQPSCAIPPHDPHLHLVPRRSRAAVVWSAILTTLIVVIVEVVLAWLSA